MTPEQIRLRAYKAEMAQLAGLCDAEGTRHHEAHGYRPAAGYLPALSRTARVFTIADGSVLVKQTETSSRRFANVLQVVVRADDLAGGKSVAEQWCAACVPRDGEELVPPVLPRRSRRASRHY